ncbi:MAG: 2-hydroxyhepta-2,4-diene-1,7-dioate isomerase [Flavobacteriales bacterium]|nr:2-hydroxyhepta-2,4-diene-1,7-dioate isomerase [Candidatus Arcticimaribacter sp.]|tara:strand:+ start:1179 stop:1790 length:612 start_codon:yes stop_codon:yes gene_type:complete
MKIICIGRNYSGHIEELVNEKLVDPVVFLKPDTSLVLKNQPFFIPPFSDDVHHEVEVLIRINRIGKHIQQKFSHKYYDQISLGIDFTARDLQAKLKAKGLPWEKAKAFDGAAVVGDWISKSELPNVDQLQFEMTKNGNLVQSASTALMLWKVDELISYVSQFFTLKIGDIIFTGTPAGVGPVRTDDVLEGFLEGHRLFSIKVK